MLLPPCSWRVKSGTWLLIFSILMYELFYCCLNIRLDRTIQFISTVICISLRPICSLSSPPNHKYWCCNVLAVHDNVNLGCNWNLASVRNFIKCLKKQSNPITGLDRPWGFQEAEAPRFQDSRHVKVVRLSVLHNGRLNPPRKYSWYSFLLEAVNPRAVVRPEGFCQWKIPMSPSNPQPSYL
jgi:hypothetical protein